MIPFFHFHAGDSVCLSLSAVSVYLSLSLSGSVCLFVSFIYCLSMALSVCLYVSVLLSQSVCLFTVSPCLCLSVCLSILIHAYISINDTCNFIFNHL